MSFNSVIRDRERGLRGPMLIDSEVIAGVNGLYDFLDATRPPLPDMISYGSPTGAPNDVVAAFTDAKTADPTVRFHKVSGAATTYYFTTASASMFDGTTLDVEPSVTISLPGLDASAPVYGTIAKLSFRQPTTVAFRDINVETVFPADSNAKAVPQYHAQEHRRKWSARPLYASLGEIKLRSMPWTPAADTWADETGTTTDHTLSYSAISGKFVVAFVEIGVGEKYTCSISNLPVDGSGAIGIFVRGTGGFAFVYDVVFSSAALAYSGGKYLGQPFVQAQDTDYPNRGVNTTFAFSKSLYSVLRLDRDRVAIMLNGQTIRLTDVGFANVGDIQEVGVGYFSNGSGSTVIQSNFIVEKSDEVNGMPWLANIAFFGDSTVEDMAGGWVRRLPELLEGSYGLRVGPIANAGVVSTTSAQAYTAMQVPGAFGNAYVIGICTGTNDIQGQTTRANFTATWNDMLDYAIAQIRRPYVVIPYLWYDTADAGSTGFNTDNADGGAWYRSEIMRICALKGVPFWDPCAEVGNPDPTLRTDPRGGYHLRDNIHQTPGKLNAFYAKGFAKMLVSDYCQLPEAHTSRIWDTALGTGVTAVSGYEPGYETESGKTIRLYGFIDVTTITDGTTVLTLPRHLRPARETMGVPLAFDGASAPLSPGPRVAISTDGQVKIYGAPVGTVRLGLDTIQLQAA